MKWEIPCPSSKFVCCNPPADIGKRSWLLLIGDRKKTEYPPSEEFSHSGGHAREALHEERDGFAEVVFK